MYLCFVTNTYTLSKNTPGQFPTILGVSSVSLKDCRSYLVFIAFNWQNELRFNSFILLLKWVTMTILHVAFILLINKLKKSNEFH